MMHRLFPLVLAAGLAAGAITTAAAPGEAISTGIASAEATKKTAIDITPPPAVFIASERAVSTWRSEAVKALDLAPAAAADLMAGHESTPVARCVKLNNYWCIKKAGWTGEIAADGEGHVAFSTAIEGAAVAALLLKRYYVDFNRKTALAIVARWAPAQCGAAASVTRRKSPRTLASTGYRSTLRARWLAAHARGSVKPIVGEKKATVPRSIVADRVPRLMPTPTIALGLGDVSVGRDRVLRPITLDALERSRPDALPSRSMLGLTVIAAPGANATSCAGDTARVAAYAAKAATGIEAAPDGDLGLFDATGAPTERLAIMMANMAKVEIGPLGANAALIKDGIAAAFKPGRNPS